MKPFKKLHLLHCLLALNVMLGSSISNHDQRKNYCGNIRTQKPFLNQNSSISSSLLSSITLCRSQNLYFRTSLGLFQVSSIDFDAKILTIISHSSYSSSLEYVSPLAVTSGFPSPPEPNSLILFNCSRKIDPFSPFMKICTNSHKNHDDEENHYSCLVVEDLQKVEEGFHPKDFNCTHYMWAHRIRSSSSSSSSSSDGEEEDHDEEFKYGARLSFDIPAVPEICKGCVKPNGTCGGGLNCLCHAKECKDKVISKVGSIKSIGSVFFSLFITFLSMVQ